MPRRPPPVATPTSLREAALEHVARWATTRANLRRLLLRRVERSVAAHGGDAEPLVAAVDGVLDDLVRAGVIDDAAYARSKAASWQRRGVSRRALPMRLAAKGVPRDVAGEVVSQADDLKAACAYTRKRRLGPYGGSEKDLDRLGRAGFPYDLARRVLAMSVEQIEEILLG